MLDSSAPLWLLLRGMELVILILTGCDQAPLRGQQPEKPPALPEDRYLVQKKGTGQEGVEYAALRAKFSSQGSRDRAEDATS